MGVYPETKHPTYFDSIGLSLEEPLVELLHTNGYRGRRAPVYIQSFEVANLVQLAGMTRLPLVQLIGGEGAPYDMVVGGHDRTFADLVTPAALAEIAEHADGIGPSKDLIVPRDDVGALLEPTSLVDDAHDAGLVVHPYAFRNENAFLPADHRDGNPAAESCPRAAGLAPLEYQAFFDLGIDGVFSDHPDTAVARRHDWRRRMHRGR